MSPELEMMLQVQENQAEIIERQIDEIRRLKSELENYRSIAEQAGATIAVSELEQARQEIANLKAEGLVSESMIDGLIKQVAQAQHDRDYYKRELVNTQTQ